MIFLTQFLEGQLTLFILKRKTWGDCLTLCFVNNFSKIGSIWLIPSISPWILSRGKRLLFDAKMTQECLDLCIANTQRMTLVVEQEIALDLVDVRFAGAL